MCYCVTGREIEWARVVPKVDLKKRETELLKACWSESGSDPGVGDKVPVQNRDNGTVKTRGSF